MSFVVIKITGTFGDTKTARFHPFPAPPEPLTGKQPKRNQSCDFGLTGCIKWDDTPKGGLYPGSRNR